MLQHERTSNLDGGPLVFQWQPAGRWKRMVSKINPWLESSRNLTENSAPLTARFSLVSLTWVWRNTFRTSETTSRWRLGESVVCWKGAVSSPWGSSRKRDRYWLCNRIMGISTGTRFSWWPPAVSRIDPGNGTEFRQWSLRALRENAAGGLFLYHLWLSIRL